MLTLFGGEGSLSLFSRVGSGARAAIAKAKRKPAPQPDERKVATASEKERAEVSRQGRESLRKSCAKVY